MTKNNKVVLPDETIEKLLNNEFQMDSVGTDEIEIPVVEVKPDEVEEHKETIKTESKTKKVEYNDVNYAGRGFKSLKEAIDFMETPYFKGLGEADKNEYRNWLIK